MGYLLGEIPTKDLEGNPIPKEFRDQAKRARKDCEETVSNFLIRKANPHSKENKNIRLGINPWSIS